MSNLPKIPSIPAAKQKSLAAQTELIKSQCQQLVISDTHSYQLAGELLKRIKTHTKSIEEVRNPILAAAKSLIDTIKGEFGALLDPLIAARDTIDKSMSIYRREQEAARLAQLERDRLKQEAITTQLKIDRASELLSSGDDGDTAEGERLLESLSGDQSAADNYIPPMTRDLVPELKILGVGKPRQLPRYRIIDSKLINPNYLMPDHAKIQAAITAHGKGAESIVGGIQYYTEPSKSSVRG